MTKVHAKLKTGLMTAALVFSGAVWAQSYRAKAVRIIVPQAPRGGNDTIARLIGHRLSQTLKQQFAVDNRRAPGGLIAAELVAKSAPDGYTLLLVSVAKAAFLRASSRPASRASSRLCR